MPRAKITKSAKPSSTTSKSKAAVSKTKTIKSEKVIKSEAPIDADTNSGSEILATNKLFPLPENISNLLYSKITYIIVLIIGVLVVFYYNKSWFIAATVNGMPISNFELISQLNKQFRDQTLTQMINEKIILDEAQKNGIVITQSDIDQKMADLEKNVGGAQALDSLLSQQGQTRDSLMSQLRIQIAIEKLYSKDATVSSQEVDQFISQNKDQLKATDSAGQRAEATDDLKQQKLSQIFNDKFPQLKQNAKVTIF